MPFIVQQRVSLGVQRNNPDVEVRSPPWIYPGGPYLRNDVYS